MDTSRRALLKAAVVGGIAGWGLAACGNDDDGGSGSAASASLLDKLRGGQPLKVASYSQAPWGFKKSNGEIAGLEPTVARTIAAEIGAPPRWFAYPFGARENLKPEYVPLIAEAGYDGAVSAFGGRVRPGGDPRVLPREATPYFRSLEHLEAYLTGCLDWMYRRKEAAPTAGARTPLVSSSPGGLS